MRRRIVMILCAVALASCGGNKEEERTHEGARTAAERFCKMLRDGEYEAYVEGLSGALSGDSIMKKELTAVVRQYMEREQEVHGGISEATAVNDTIYSDSLAQVFMDITYGDSSVEHVAMPLLYTNGRWKMR